MRNNGADLEVRVNDPNNQMHKVKYLGIVIWKKTV